MADGIVQTKDEIIIGNFQGIAPDPLMGFGHIRNLDTTTNPGTVRINNIPIKTSGSVVTNFIVASANDPAQANSIWAVDKVGVVYHSTDNGATWTTVAGNTGGTALGMGIWKDYLFVAYDNVTNDIDVYGPLSSGGPAWTNSWQVLGDSAASTDSYIPILRSTDDKLYFGFGRYVASLAENTIFVPATPATYTYTQKAITLPSNIQARALADLGSSLMIGTAGLAILRQNNADIYPYLRAPGSSALTLGLPIKLQKNGVMAMKTVGNIVYVQAGTEGELFITDGVSIDRVAKIPNYIINLDGTTFLEGACYAIMYQQDKLYFTAQSGSTSGLSNCGVWSYNPKTHGLQLENIISTGGEGITNTLKIGSLIPNGRNTYGITWQDNTTYGIDIIDSTKRYTSYSAYFESALVPIGDAVNRDTIQGLEIYFQKPLVTGQGAQIYWRTDLTSSYTLLSTVDFATFGGVVSKTVSATVISKANFVQIKCVLTCGPTLNLSPELVIIVLKLSK